MSRIIPAFTQFFDDSGNPLVNGKLRFFESGTNNTDKDTFADSALMIPNTNPVDLDGAGRCPNVFGDGAYNVISYTSDNVQIQQFDPVGAVNSGGAFEDWVATNIYGEGDIVSYEGEYYRSLGSGNQNNNPASSPASWEQLELGRIYNSTVIYSKGDNVYASNGILYVSQVDANLNNDPVTDSGLSWVSYDQPLFVVATGTGDAQVVDFPINVTLRDGATIYVSSVGANTVTNPTITIDGALKTIVKNGNQPLDASDIASGLVMQLVYRSGNDNVELLNSGGGANADLSNLTSVGNEKIAVAWVNFNGTGVVSIRDSYNVSSIIDNGTGNYTINFTNPLPNADYTPVYSGSGYVGVSPNGGGWHVLTYTTSGGGAPALKTTTQLQIATSDAVTAIADSFEVYVVIFSGS